MYTVLLFVHGWVRWVVLAAGFVAVGRAVLGLATRRGWAPGDEKGVRWFVESLNAQAFFGIVLYAVSPFTLDGMRDMAGTMANAPLRFFVVEHPVGMVIALGLAHVGRARLRRAQPDRRHTIATLFFGVALAVILASIPWPFSPGGRALFRGL